MSAEKTDTHIRKEQIAKAALEIVQNQGLKAMTIKRISHEIGLVPSAIYRHFKNKNEVFNAVLEIIRKGLLKNVEQAREEADSHIECLKVLLIFQTRMIQNFPAILPRIAFSDDVLMSHAIRKKRVYSLLQSYLDAIGEIFKEGQAVGEIRSDISPGSLAMQFFGLFQPPSFLFLLSDGDYDVEKQIDQAWTFFSESIKAR